MSLLLPAATSTQASADDPADGLWYLDEFGFEAFHDSGRDGQNVTIAVIDEAISVDAGRDDGVIVTGPSYCYDSAGLRQPATSEDATRAWHGTNVVAYLLGDGAAEGVVGVAPGASVRFYSAGGDGAACFAADGAPNASADAVANAIVDAVHDHADIILVTSMVSTNPEQALLYAFQQEVIVVAPALDLDAADSSATPPRYPGASNGVVGVGVYGQERNLAADSVAQPLASRYVDVIAPGLGLLNVGSQAGWSDRRLVNDASYAAAIVAGEVALAMQGHLNAAPNQILQLLAGSAVIDDESWVGVTGFGAVAPYTFIGRSPDQETFFNPFLTAESPTGPTVMEVREAVHASATPLVEDERAATESLNEPYWILIFPLLAVVGVIVGVIVFLVVVVSHARDTARRRRAAKTTEAEPEAS